MLWRMIEPPTIPIELSVDEIKTCKKLAYDRLLKIYPELEDKELRKSLMSIEKVQVVNALSRLFEEEANNILYTK